MPSMLLPPFQQTDAHRQVVIIIIESSVTPCFPGSGFFMLFFFFLGPHPVVHFLA